MMTTEPEELPFKEMLALLSRQLEEGLRKAEVHNSEEAVIVVQKCVADFSRNRLSTTGRDRYTVDAQQVFVSGEEDKGLLDSHLICSLCHREQRAEEKETEGERPLENRPIRVRPFSQGAPASYTEEKGSLSHHSVGDLRGYGYGSNSAPEKNGSKEELWSIPPIWVPDSSVSDCTRCRSPFSLSRRRHHCRSCGNIFCSYCSNRKIPLPVLGMNHPQRVCDSCFEVLWQRPQPNREARSAED